MSALWMGKADGAERAARPVKTPPCRNRWSSRGCVPRCGVGVVLAPHGGDGGNVRYGSVCSGIEAATVAWHGLGWAAAWYSEIEPFPCAVLAHHYPTVPNLGDMTLLPGRIRSG